MKHKMMKRTLAGVLAVLCVAGYLPANVGTGGLFGDTAIVASAMDGSGTKDNPYLLSDKSDYTSFFNTVNESSSSEIYAKVKTDLEVTSGLTRELNASGKTIYLDTNGHTVRAERLHKISAGNLVIVDTASTHGKIYQKSNGSNFFEVYEGASLTIKDGGTIEDSANNTGIFISGGTVTIGNGGTVVDNYDGYGSGYRIIYIGSGELNVEAGAKITNSGNKERIIYTSGGTVNISGGTFNTKNIVISIERVTVNISGGTFIYPTTSVENLLYDYIDSYESVNITGGTFSTSVAKYLDSNVVSETENADGTYTVKTCPTVTISGKNGLIFNNSSQKLLTGAASVTGNGTIHYKVDDGNWTTDWNAVTAIASGTHTIKYYVDASAEYSALGSSDSPKSLTVEITKGTPSYTVPSGLTATRGQTLADVALPTGWAWVDSSQSVGDAGGKTFKATFTPEDTYNYNIVENVDVPVTVKKIDLSAATVTVDNTAKTVSVSLDGTPITSGYSVEYINQGTNAVSTTFPTEGGKYIAKITADTDGDYEGEAESTVFAIDKLTEGRNKIACIKDGKPYTRFIFVVAKSELKGVKKAEFVVSKDGKSMTAYSTKYYTGSTVDGVKYTPASSDYVLFTVSITGTDSNGLECRLNLIK